MTKSLLEPTTDGYEGSDDLHGSRYYGCQVSEPSLLHGSVRLTAPSLAADELTVRIDSPRVHDSYVNQFNYLKSLS